MKANQEICVSCKSDIDRLSLSFEQRLIGDSDFCRSCWNVMMIDERDEEFPLAFVAIAKGK